MSDELATAELLVIHMVTAANGKEEFYSIENHACRSEGIQQARDRDIKAAEAWVGHPNVDSVKYYL